MTCNLCSDLKPLVCILIVLFGTGSWIIVNGIWVELPILVNELPEGWNLPSYMAVIIQLANVGPITVTLCNVCMKKRPPEKVIIGAMLVVGSLASFLLAFFWTKTSNVAGTEHSTALFVLMFILSLVTCTSSVTFLPFMNIFKPKYLTFYYTGGGLSGLLPSILALAQGVGQVDCVTTNITNSTSNSTEYLTKATYRPAKFAVKYFFLIIFAMMVTCGIAFILLNCLLYCKSEHSVNGDHTGKSRDQELATVNSKSNSNEFEDTSKEHSEYQNKSNQLVPMNEKKEPRMSKYGYFYYLSLIAWVNALSNSVLPSIQTYACLPYGHQIYHLAVTLEKVAGTVTYIVAFFLPVGSALFIGAMALLGSGFVSYIVMLAVLSPMPPLVKSVAGTGAVFVVTAFVLVSFLLSLIKVSIAALFRTEGRKALLWCGAVTQLGSAIGAAAMFVSINVYSVFVQKNECT